MHINRKSPVSTISARLTEALEQSHMTAADLAMATEISTAAISHYQSGRYVPKRDRLVALASPLHVSPTWLLGYDAPSQTIDEPATDAPSQSQSASSSACTIDDIKCDS